MLELRKYADAAGLLGRVLATQPELGPAWCMLAQAELGAGRPSKAALAADRAVTLAPDDAWAHRIAFVVYLPLDRFRAAKAAERACMLNPGDWRNQVCMANAAVAVGRFADALRAAQAAQALAPDEPYVHFAAARISVARGDDEQAEAQFERVLGLDPAHAGAMNELGRMQLRRGRSGAAARHFLRAARSAPGELAFGHNVEIAVASAERRLRQFVRSLIYLSSLLVVLLVLIPLQTTGQRIWLSAVLAAAVISMICFWVLQLMRLPAEVRPLFRSGYIAAALGLALCPLLAAILLVEFGHLTTLVAFLPLVVAAMFGSRLLAYRILASGAARRAAQISRRLAA
jgi:tetratricopeptide (TPR) repeat protein